MEADLHEQNVVKLIMEDAIFYTVCRRSVLKNKLLSTHFIHSFRQIQIQKVEAFIEKLVQ